MTRGVIRGQLIGSGLAAAGWEEGVLACSKAVVGLEQTAVPLLLRRGFPTASARNKRDRAAHLERADWAPRGPCAPSGFASASRCPLFLY
jgi:hypothetical protein